MKITKLEKKKRLYLLELDNDQKLYITEDTIVKYFLSKDKEISEEELKEIKSLLNTPMVKPWPFTIFFLKLGQQKKSETT